MSSSPVFTGTYEVMKPGLPQRGHVLAYLEPVSEAETECAINGALGLILIRPLTNEAKRILKVDLVGSARSHDIPTGTARGDTDHSHSCNTDLVPRYTRTKDKLQMNLTGRAVTL